MTTQFKVCNCNRTMPIDAQAREELSAALGLDQLEVTTEVAKIARTYVEFQQNILRGNELVCEGLIRIACVSSETMKPNPIPATMFERIKSHTITN